MMYVYKAQYKMPCLIKERRILDHWAIRLSDKVRDCMMHVTSDIITDFVARKSFYRIDTKLIV